MTLEKCSLHRAGIKPSHINKLRELGIYTILDLLYYFPRDHIICKCVQLAEAKVGETVTIIGKITAILIMKFQLVLGGISNSRPSSIKVSR